MELVDIRNIKTSQVSVYYHMQYTGNAVFEIGGRETISPILFVIEIGPLGEKKVSVKILQSIDYPLIPLLRVLRERVIELYNSGVLI